jgi:NAD(P)-dependent dehydrogenase (short-subunit alcohol dehydrogenase family)
VENFAPEHWDEALAVNLSARFHTIRLTLPAMRRKNWGRIVNMASIHSRFATVNRIDYMTTKTALLGLTRAVALECARTGITCDAVCPGTVPTPAIDGRPRQETQRDGTPVRGSRESVPRDPPTVAPLRQGRQRRRSDRVSVRAARRRHHRRLASHRRRLACWPVTISFAPNSRSLRPAGRVPDRGSRRAKQCR